MMSSIPKDGFSSIAFEAFLDGRKEPSWLVERRREAFHVFQKTPWPTARDEEWRRTDIRGFKLDAFAPPAPFAIEPDDLAAVAPVFDLLNHNYGTGIEQINGITTHLADATILGDARFLDLTSALSIIPDLLQHNLLKQAVDPSADAFSALHSAFWTGGTVLHVPKGLKLEIPLFSLICLVGRGQVDFDHTLIILEEGSEATLVRETTSCGRVDLPALHVGAVELIVGPNARLRFANIQNWDAKTWHFSRERALVGHGGSIEWTVGGLGSRLAKVNQDVVLTGEGADARVNGVLFTTARQHIAYFTRQDHQASHTTSDLLYKGGVKDHSRVVWKGMIKVDPDAQKTNAYQKNDTLILSEDARADSIPGLEIEANDVRCTHGATAGQVDREMIFYCQARGISKSSAVRLIVEGFFASVYDRISLEPVRETLRDAIAAKLQLSSDAIRLDQVNF